MFSLRFQLGKTKLISDIWGFNWLNLEQVVTRSGENMWMSGICQSFSIVCWSGRYVGRVQLLVICFHESTFPILYSNNFPNNFLFIKSFLFGQNWDKELSLKLTFCLENYPRSTESKMTVLIKLILHKLWTKFGTMGTVCTPPLNFTSSDQTLLLDINEYFHDEENTRGPSKEFQNIKWRKLIFGQSHILFMNGSIKTLTCKLFLHCSTFLLWFNKQLLTSLC